MEAWHDFVKPIPWLRNGNREKYGKLTIAKAALLLLVTIFLSSGVAESSFLDELLQ